METNLAPVSGQQRIQVMDLLRGFALIGILFMNIEWFNRPDVNLLQFDYSQTGGDWASSWLVTVFVEGKFYKLFSLLFGMGFAVMLLRAQEVGRPFGWWFTRRMLVLFVIGLAHMIFFWGGDILHDYAVGGMYLLGFVYLLRWKKLSKYNSPTAFAKTGFTLLLVPFVFAIFGGIFFGVTQDHNETKEVWQESYEVRALRDTLISDAKEAGTFELTEEQYLAREAENEAEAAKEDNVKVVTKTKSPEIAEAEMTTSEALDSAKLSAEDSSGSESTETNAVSTDNTEAAKEQTREERIAEQAQTRFENRQMQDYRTREEAAAFTNGSYAEATEHRLDKAINALGRTPFFGFFICLPLFMVGYWLVASDRIRRPEEHTSFFNVLCYGGLFIGLCLNITGVYLSLHPAAKAARELQAVGGNIFFLGHYILCAGYLGLIVKLSAKAWFNKVFAWLAPLGKMALTNYLMHSVVFTTVFYGYGMGLFGQVSRSEQMLFVVGMIAFQAVLSTLWLRFFKFGPMEWLWRCLTYASWQPIKREHVAVDLAHAK